MSFKFNEFDLRGLDNRVTRIAKKLPSQIPLLLERIADNLANSAKTRIERTKQSPEGIPWSPLKSNIYKNAKAQAGRTAGLLVLSGDLQRGLAGQGNIDGSASIISDVPYANIHQFGGQAGINQSANIPARPFVGISRQDRQEITEEIEDTFQRLFA